MDAKALRLARHGGRHVKRKCGSLWPMSSLWCRLGQFWAIVFRSLGLLHLFSMGPQIRGLKPLAFLPGVKAVSLLVGLVRLLEQGHCSWKLRNPEWLLLLVPQTAWRQRDLTPALQGDLPVRSLDKDKLGCHRAVCLGTNNILLQKHSGIQKGISHWPLHSKLKF